MRGFALWRWWLVVASLAICGFGLAMSVASTSSPFDQIMGRIDAQFWGQSGPPPEAAAFQRWVYGAWGATVAGWGLMMAFLAWVPLGRGEPWARNALAVSLALWFVLDTFYSLYFGVWINVLLNLTLFVAMGLPLLFIWRRMGSPA
ncbi:MAG: hypothetical protein KJ720_08115 [Proteobacteria bacterium]|nr:hypothetical protein [Pseudomonadota bacterium]MBU1452366.1 hypothetical protein [Pseudomonadota bacterium]MBU2467468.1 hypothetical protein [Pseudomonadota bacterium]MBU2517007.1 hypothetical protein [Pseudomonadota bacterium]